MNQTDKWKTPEIPLIPTEQEFGFENAHLTDITKCRRPGKFIVQGELNCPSYLEKEIRTVEPDFLIAVGEDAYMVLPFTLELLGLRWLAHKLQNPRLLKITFHTFRHWKATMLYHQTKDPYYVKQFLGHKSIQNTEIYITVERTLFGEYSDEFTVRVTSKPEEIKELLETGFEYVCTKDELMFFRKRK